MPTVSWAGAPLLPRGGVSPASWACLGGGRALFDLTEGHLLRLLTNHVWGWCCRRRVGLTPTRHPSYSPPVPLFRGLWTVWPLKLSRCLSSVEQLCTCRGRLGTPLARQARAGTWYPQPENTTCGEPLKDTLLHYTIRAGQRKGTASDVRRKRAAWPPLPCPSPLDPPRGLGAFMYFKMSKQASLRKTCTRTA